MLDLADEESDAAALAEVTPQIQSLGKRIQSFSLELMLDDEDDGNNAIVSINAGAGGTEAQDWAEMLFRMYTRWVERKGFKLDIIDFQPGEEAGIKSVTLYSRRRICIRLFKVGNRCASPGENFSL